MYLVRQYEDKEVCVRRGHDDIRNCHHVRGEAAAWQVLGRVNGYHSTFLVRCFTVHYTALMCAELAQYCTLTFSWSVLIISVSFLPLTSSSKTHIVTCRRTVPAACSGPLHCPCSGPLHTVHAQVPCTLSMLRSPALSMLRSPAHCPSPHSGTSPAAWRHCSQPAWRWQSPSYRSPRYTPGGEGGVERPASGWLDDKTIFLVMFIQHISRCTTILL